MNNHLFSKKNILSFVVLIFALAAIGFSQKDQGIDTERTESTATVPANDNLVNAEFLFGVEVHVQRSNVGATKEMGEPNHANNAGGKSVWFCWTAPRTGSYTFTTNRNPTNFDTLLHLYSVSQGVIVATYGGSNNINAPYDLRSFANLFVQQGVTYYIAIDGVSVSASPAAEGLFELDIQPRLNYQGADYDSDGMTDMSVFRPSNGTWYIYDSSSLQTSTSQWGTNGDIPIVSTSGNTVGNDYGVFRPSTGMFYGLNDPYTNYALPWGTTGDIPVPAQYSGEANTNIAVFRPTNGTWYIRYSENSFRTCQFGSQGDIPVPGQYSGDQFADIAVFRPSTGVWYFQKRVSTNPAADTYSAVTFGQAGDKPVPADYDGDGILDVAIYRPSTGTWWVLQSTNNQAIAFAWGIAEDVPTTGDFDGDGKFDFAVFRPSSGVWYIHRSSDGGVQTMHFGQSGDIPVTAGKTF